MLSRRQAILKLNNCLVYWCRYALRGFEELTAVQKNAERTRVSADTLVRLHHTLRRRKAIETFNIQYIPRIVWGCCNDIGVIMRLPQWVKQPWSIWVNVSCEYKRSRTVSIWRYCLTSIGKAHCEDETVLRPHYVHNGGFCTGKKNLPTPHKWRWAPLPNSGEWPLKYAIKIWRTRQTLKALECVLIFTLLVVFPLVEKPGIHEIWNLKSKLNLKANVNRLKKCVLHLWSMFDDSRLNRWWVIARTNSWLTHKQKHGQI